MKKNKIIFNILYSLLFIVFFSSCKKGQQIEYAVFSTLEIDAALSNNTKLVVNVDEATSDTIRGSGVTRFNVNSGERRVVIRDITDHILVDTMLFFEKYQTKRLTRFFYTGSSLLFADPDTTRKPATPGNVLLRFVTTASTLPEEMNIEIVLFYTQAGVRQIVPIAGSSVTGVRKDRFSGYIELANPVSLLPAGVASGSYAIIGTNSATGERVMDINVVTSSPMNTYTIVRYVAGTGTIVFIPNKIISLGIDEPLNASTKIRQPKIIFERIAP